MHLRDSGDICALNHTDSHREGLLVLKTWLDTTDTLSLVPGVISPVGEQTS